MKDLYLAVKARIIAQCPDIQFVHIYNNQFSQITDEGRDNFSFPFPCAFVEIVAPNEIQQLGNGAQLYEGVIVRIHIGDDYYNNYTDGSQDENLRIFDLRQSVYDALQKFTPDKCVTFVRVEESQDFDHTNVYHYIQDYKTNYVDISRVEPVGGSVGEPPFTLVVQPTYTIPQHG